MVVNFDPDIQSHRLLYYNVHSDSPQILMTQGQMQRTQSCFETTMTLVIHIDPQKEETSVVFNGFWIQSRLWSLSSKLLY